MEEKSKDKDTLNHMKQSDETNHFSNEIDLQSTQKEATKFSFSSIDETLRQDTEEPLLQQESETRNVVSKQEEKEQTTGYFDGSAYNPTKEKNEKKEPHIKKAPTFKAMLAALLICSLLGGAIGSGITWAFLKNTMTGNPSYVTPQQIDTQAVSPVTAVAEACVPTVVSILNTSTEVYNFMGMTYAQDQQASGSGVIISGEGYIVTNYHVIENANKLVVMLYDGRSFEADIIGGDEDSDLAVIKIEADNLTVAAIGDSDQLRVGELVVAIGNPLDATAFAWTVTDGIVSGLGRIIEKDSQSFKLIQTNAAINAGNSGGALLNAKGELIGINTMKIADATVEGMGFAIPVNDSMPIIEQLMEKGYVSKPYIGIGGYDLTENLRKQIHCDAKSGILITQITENSPAEQSGLKIGDVIYEINGTALQNFDALKEILTESQVGDLLTVKIERQGNKSSLGIIIGERNSKMTLQQAPQANYGNNNYFPFSKW